jgi:hypothetical protein
LLLFFRRHWSSGGLRLFLLVFLTLYLELTLIRFCGAEIVYLAYFSNFVLMAVFLGLGVGFLLARSRHDIFPLLPQALLAQVAFVLVTRLDLTWMRENLGQLLSWRAGFLPAVAH